MTKKITIQETEHGFSYCWNGVPISIKAKPMSMYWYEYIGKLGDLKKTNPEMWAWKVLQAEKYFGLKGPEYSNILRHIEDTIDW